MKINIEMEIETESRWTEQNLETLLRSLFRVLELPCVMEVSELSEIPEIKEPTPSPIGEGSAF